MSGEQAEAVVDGSATPGVVRRISLAQIRESDTALRGVNRDTEDYKQLLDSIRKHGVLENITVRECVDPATQAKYYGLINGLQRFSCAKDAGLTEIDAKVIQANDFEVLQKQIILNARRVETKPAEYSQQLKRMLIMNPGMTMNEMAATLSCSTGFLYERLALLKLNNEIAKLVDSGEISLPNAYSLAKLPPDEQVAYKDRAITQSSQEFIPQVTERVKQLNEAKRKGADPKPEGFVAVARQRKLEDLKTENERPTVGRQLISDLKITDPVDAFALGVKWALCLDPISIQQAKAKDEARRKEAEEAKARRAEEKAQKEKDSVVANAMGV